MSMRIKLAETALALSWRFREGADADQVKARFVLRALELRIRPALALYRDGKAKEAGALLRQFNWCERERLMGRLGIDTRYALQYAKSEDERAGFVSKLGEHADAIEKAAKNVLANEPNAKVEYAQTVSAIEAYREQIEREASDREAEQTLAGIQKVMQVMQDNGFDRRQAFDVAGRLFLAGAFTPKSEA